MTEEVVVGVGNPIMGDDGVGKHVVDGLYERPAVADGDVTVTHAGTTAFLALEALSGADRGVVVDAVSTGDSPPGSVHRYRLVEGAFEGDPPDVFMHDFSFAEAVQAGREAYDLPPAVVVLGVEPADTSAGLALSGPVREQLPAVVDAVLAELTTVDASDGDAEGAASRASSGAEVVETGPETATATPTEREQPTTDATRRPGETGRDT